MKRSFAILLALALLLSLCACAEKKTPGADPAGNGTAATPAGSEPAAPDTEPDVIETAPEEIETAPEEIETAPEETDTAPDVTEPAPPESEENAGGFTSEYERAYGMIQETYAAEGSYSDAYGTYNYYYHLPNLIPTTPGANAINMKLADRFSSEITESLSAIHDGTGTALLEVSWYIFIYDGVINLVVSDHLDWGDAYYYEVYYYDMNTGNELTPQQMIARITLTEQDFLDGARDACVRQFEFQYSGLTEDQRQAAGYYDMLAYQKSDELINFEMLKLYVDDGGNVGVYCPIASIAGAAYYYQLLYPSFNMG